MHRCSMAAERLQGTAAHGKPDEVAAFVAFLACSNAADATITVVGAAGTPSGVYGLSVDNGIGTDIIPFYVLRNPALPRQKILFLAPTFTYMAYANHARGNFSGALHARVKEWNAYPHNPDVVGAYGHSTYNRHPDGSGVTLSSRLRPIMTMRPQYLLGRK